jgi:hypothetical protein
MSDHWDWALEQTEQQFCPTHVAFLTDRMVFRDGTLPLLHDLITTHPEEVIAYNHDGIDDMDATSVRLQAYSGDGHVYRMDSRSILRTTAAGDPFQWALPRMLNCVVPRTVFTQLRDASGHVFSSVSPDYYFGYRVLGIRDDFLCVNHSLIAAHSSRRSNGHSTKTGVFSPDAQDFRSRTNIGNWRTPFPEVDTVSNSVLHEYAVVRGMGNADRFPPLSEVAVRELLLQDADAMIDRDRASAVRTELGASNGAVKPSGVRIVARRVASALSHPGRSLGPRTSYKVLPPATARLLQPILPGGVFKNANDALVVARARPRRAVQATVPSGTVGRVHSGDQSSDQRSIECPTLPARGVPVP